MSGQRDLPVENTFLTSVGDEKEKKNEVTGCRATCGIFGKYVVVKLIFLGIYCLDIFTDVNVAYRDYIVGDHIFAYVTIGLVFNPGILFSLYMFCESILKYCGEFACIKSIGWLLVGPFLPIWPILRDLRLIFLGLMCTLFQSKRKEWKPVLDRPSRAHLVKFLEAFLEAAPQLLVRLYRVATRNPQQFVDLTSSEIAQITTSLVTLSLKIVMTHQKMVLTEHVIEGDMEQETKYKMPWFAQVTALIWWGCFLLARFEALALFTASYGVWVLLVVGIHILLLFGMQAAYNIQDNFRRLIIYFFGAFIFVFAYVEFNLKSRVKTNLWLPYIIFTIIVFIENTIMLIFWFFDQRSMLSSGELYQSNSTMIVTNSPASATPSPENAHLLQVTKDLLHHHWEVLLYIHYGVFAAGALFMIITFIIGSVSGRTDMKRESSEQEMVSVTKIEQYNR